MITMTKRWDDVRVALDDTLGITWDGCHKIYLLMDEQQMQEFAEYDYDIATIGDGEDDISTSEAFAVLQDWYDGSCFLRFLTAVRTNEADPNVGYEDLIPQGAEEDDD